MVAGKLFSYPENFRVLKVLICSKYGGHDVKLDSDFQFGTTNLTKQFLSKFPLGKVPCVELDTDKLMDETNSMAWHLCPGEMTGEQDKEKQAEVIRWMTLAEVEVTPPACNWVYPVIGVLQQSEGMARGKQDLLKLLTQFNSELRLKTWLVGERISLADICLACSLLLVFTHVMDQEIKDKLPHLTRWFNTVVNQKKVKEVLDQVEMSEEGEEEKMFKVAKWKCELVNSYFENDMDIDKSSGYEESGDIKEEFSGMRAESSNDQLGNYSRDRCRFPHITESEIHKELVQKSQQNNLDSNGMISYPNSNRTRNSSGNKQLVGWDAYKEPITAQHNAFTPIWPAVPEQ